MTLWILLAMGALLNTHNIILLIHSDAGISYSNSDWTGSFVIIHNIVQIDCEIAVIVLY
jgi:hypothetical protein